MKWKKLHYLPVPVDMNASVYSHAALPIAEHITNDLFKIYFTSRDCDNRSHINYLILNLNNPSKILDFSKTPILSPGSTGTFDEDGAMLSWILNFNNQKYYYYIGWNIGRNKLFRNSIGLASENSCAINKYPGPILDRSIYDPAFVASSCVIVDNQIWKMWYLSCIKWAIVDGVLRHYYHLKYAESDDGVQWRRNGHVCIDFKDSAEYAISRPCVLKEQDGYKMWYSYRGNAYKIGYATSKDGLNWIRKDEEAGISVSGSGWDSEMIEYPFVFDHNNQRYMLYNGNGYGATGFGLCILEHD